MSDSSRIITKFNETGVCEIDCNLLVSIWDPERYLICQFRKVYRFLIESKDDPEEAELKAEISKAQAHYVIGHADLNCYQCDIFNSGKLWMREDANKIGLKMIC